MDKEYLIGKRYDSFLKIRTISTIFILSFMFVFLTYNINTKWNKDSQTFRNYIKECSNNTLLDFESTEDKNNFYKKSRLATILSKITVESNILSMETLLELETSIDNEEIEIPKLNNRIYKIFANKIYYESKFLKQKDYKSLYFYEKMYQDEQNCSLRLIFFIEINIFLIGFITLVLTGITFSYYLDFCKKKKEYLKN